MFLKYLRIGFCGCCRWASGGGQNGEAWGCLCLSVHGGNNRYKVLPGCMITSIQERLEPGKHW